MSDETTLQDAVRRLMAIPAWYEQFCPGPHPYAASGDKKQDSSEIMSKIAADIRTVCGAAEMTLSAREGSPRRHEGHGGLKYRKRPVVIEAVQWTGDNLHELISFTGKHPRFYEWFTCWEDYERHVQQDGRRFKIFTLEGVMTAIPGDWIIRGAKGEYYPCKPDIFSMTYEALEDNIS